MTKKQARVTGERVFSSPTDKVLDTLGGIDSTAIYQGISIEVQPDTLRKLTFQIRDSVYQQLKDTHYILDKQLGLDAPDREVIVEFALSSLLGKLTDDEELKKEIAHRQLIRKQELESGALVNPSSRKNK